MAFLLFKRCKVKSICYTLIIETDKHLKGCHMNHKERDFLDRIWDKFMLYHFKHRFVILIILILLQFVFGCIVYSDF